MAATAPKANIPAVPKPKKPKSPKRSVVVSFRVSEEDLAPYADAIEKSGYSRSVFFHKLFIERSDKIVLSEKKAHSVDYNKYLFLVNKISNNINQLARLLNGAEASKRITRQHYLNGLNTLNTIMSVLVGKLTGDN